MAFFISRVPVGLMVIPQYTQQRFGGPRVLQSDRAEALKFQGRNLLLARLTYTDSYRIKVKCFSVYRCLAENISLSPALSLNNRSSDAPL